MDFNRKLLLFALTVLLTFFFIASTYAEEAEIIEKIIVSGVGVDADKARQNAIRNAVEQIVGTYVSSDTIVKNSTLLKDEVLSYSGGYVKDTKILSQEKTDDGLFTTKIEALVISTKLKRKLESLNIATKKVEGESLFGEAVSKIDNQQTGQALLDKILSKYPQAAYTFEVGKPQILSTNPNSGKARVSIPLSIQWDQAFLSELKDVLSKVSTIELKSADIVSFGNGPNMKYRVGNKIVCFSGKRTIRSGRADVCEIIGILGEEITDSRAKKSRKSAKTKSQGISIMSLLRGDNEEATNPSGGTKLEFNMKSLLNLPVGSEKITLLLKFKDKSGKDIDAATYVFKRHDEDSPEKQGIYRNRRDSNSVTLHSVLEGQGFTPPNTLWRDLRTKHILILTDGIFKISPEVDIEVEVLKDITKVEVQMNSWEQ